jgi:hypothetical protein
MARDTLRRVHTDWQQALRFRLNAAALPVLDEMASRPWPAWPPAWRPERIGLGVFGAVPTLLLLGAFLLGAFLTFTSFAVALILALLSVASLTVLLVLSRIAYPLWILPALNRFRERNSHRPKARLAWYAVRIAVPTSAFVAPLLPPWYIEAVGMAIVITALLHCVVLFLFGRIQALGLFLPVSMVYGVFLWQAFKPFIDVFSFLVLLLPDTLFIGLRDVLHQNWQRTWNTSRARLILLTSALILVPLQFLLASKLPILAVLLGWIWFIAGCAIGDAFGWFTAFRNTVVSRLTVFLGLGITVIVFVAANDLIGADSPIVGIIGLQAAIAIATLIALVGDWLMRRRPR